MSITDYQHGLLQISASLHHQYGLETGYENDPDVTGWIEKHDLRCIVAVLIDAMGSGILRKHLDENAFFRRHMIKQTETVFPTTTAAATISFLTGRSPAENAWMGWNQYFREKDDNIVLFLNRSQYGTGIYPEFAEHALPIRKIYDELNQNGYKAASVWPHFGTSYPCQSFEEQMEKAVKLASDPEMRFVYVYWDALDSCMHQYGIDHEYTRQMLRKLNDTAEKAAERLPDDAGILFIADHGQINAEHYDLEQDAELTACLKRPPALETRAAAFYIKEGMQETFETVFRKRFGSRFTLLTHAEVLEQNVFGTHGRHPRMEEFIGDYLAIAETELQLDYIKGKDMVGSHAGNMYDERMIPVILYPEP